jgi:radical SAM superfamily enzyme YgiQ (UPF0313 family)
MHHEGIIIRPPSEADSILLQVTTGCSHNKCTFCGVYSDTTFTIKDKDIVRQDLEFASKNCKEQNKVFLCDGDALIIPQDKLLHLFGQIHHFLPWVNRIGTYANAKSLSRKTIEELRILRKNGLRIIHLGLESGDDFTLERICKWGTSNEIIRQCEKAQNAGINLFLTVLLGIAGPERSRIHAEKTGQALSKINPNYVGALSFMPIEGTALYNEVSEGVFKLSSPVDLLKELRIMLENTTMEHGYFYANHASNYLPLRIRLPRDKENALSMIDNALSGSIQLTPEWMRGL